MLCSHALFFSSLVRLASTAPATNMTAFTPINGALRPGTGPAHSPDKSPISELRVTQPLLEGEVRDDGEQVEALKQAPRSPTSRHAPERCRSPSVSSREADLPCHIGNLRRGQSVELRIQMDHDSLEHDLVVHEHRRALDDINQQMSSDPSNASRKASTSNSLPTSVTTLHSTPARTSMEALRAASGPGVTLYNSSFDADNDDMLRTLPRAGKYSSGGVSVQVEPSKDTKVPPAATDTYMEGTPRDTSYPTPGPDGFEVMPIDYDTGPAEQASSPGSAGGDEVQIAISSPSTTPPPAPRTRDRKLNVREVDETETYDGALFSTPERQLLRTCNLWRGRGGPSLVVDVLYELTRLDTQGRSRTRKNPKTRPRPSSGPASRRRSSHARRSSGRRAPRC